MSSPDVLLATHRLRNALGAAGVGTWHVDVQSRIATHDQSLNRLLGLDQVETSGSIDDLDFTRIHKDDWPRVIAAIDEAIVAHAEYGVEYRIIRPNGETRWLQDRG